MPSARTEKDLVWLAIEERTGKLRRHIPSRPDWRCTSDFHTLSVFMAYSKLDPPFYGIDVMYIPKWLDFERAFVVFVIGDHSEALVVPRDAFQALVSRLQPRQCAFKLHLVYEHRMYRFLENRTINTCAYYNGYSQLSPSGQSL